MLNLARMIADRSDNIDERLEAEVIIGVLEAKQVIKLIKKGVRENVTRN